MSRLIIKWFCCKVFNWHSWKIEGLYGTSFAPTRTCLDCGLVHVWSPELEKWLRAMDDDLF